jgi:magnesium chelatase family protein
MSTRNLKEFRQLSEGFRELLRIAICELHFSARAYDRILKVARTISDLTGREHIEEGDISEAIQYRTLDTNLRV